MAAKAVEAGPLLPWNYRLREAKEGDFKSVCYGLSTYLFQFLIRPRGYKTFFMLNSTEHENFPAHVKMPTTVGILSCMSGKIAF